MDLRTRAKHVIATGFAFGLPSELAFDVDKPYAGCLICGQVYQGPLDLKVPPNHTPDNSMIARLAKLKRDDWSRKHAATHTEHEHRMHRLSGRFATPEAAQALSAMGIFSVIDLIVDDEVSNALGEAKAMPTKEVDDR